MSEHPEEFWKLSEAQAPQPDPLQQAARERASVDSYVRGWIIIGRAPDQNGWTAEIEHSFSMATSTERVRLYRRRKDGLEDTPPGSTFDLKARWATKDWPEPMRVWDIDDPECPVTLDWVWYEQNSGDGSSRYKFEVRNLKFIPKE